MPSTPPPASEPERAAPRRPVQRLVDLAESSGILGRNNECSVSFKDTPRVVDPESFGGEKVWQRSLEVWWDREEDCESAAASIHLQGDGEAEEDQLTRNSTDAPCAACNPEPFPFTQRSRDINHPEMNGDSPSQLWCSNDCCIWDHMCCNSQVIQAAGACSPQMPSRAGQGPIHHSLRFWVRRCPQIMHICIIMSRSTASDLIYNVAVHYSAQKEPAVVSASHLLTSQPHVPTEPLGHVEAELRRGWRTDPPASLKSSCSNDGWGLSHGTN